MEPLEHQDKCVHELFAAHAAVHPEKTAAVFEHLQLSYHELYSRSSDLALYLQAQGLKPDSVVALCVERSLDMLVGLMGILQAGGAYLPLDPEYPDERLQYMLRDSRAALVLTQATLQQKLTALIPAGTQVVTLDGEWPEIAAKAAQLQQAGVQLAREVKPHHLAYVIYTSGSTGRPKGVMVEHRHLVSYATAIQDKLEIPQDSTFALISTFAADLGHTVLFPSLLSGGTLHVLSREVMTDAACYAAYCRKHRIDCMKITPSHLQALVAEETERCFIPARTLVLGGEVLSHELVDLIRAINPDCRIYNHYGPTECTVGVLCGEVARGGQPALHSVPLGAPLGATRIYVLDAEGRPVPVGEIGELYIGGPQVARGYLHQPEMTAERFLSDQFCPDAAARMYKTGDLARRLPDSTIEYLGRNDFQVKIRGFRIELQEIEARLHEHPGVRQAVVMAREDAPGDKRLVAYYTSVSSATTDEVALRAQLHEHLSACLPDFMVPAALVWLQKLPLTANGKLDRQALPAPDRDAYTAQPYEAPRGDTEITLAGMVAQLLKLERLGRHDSFFALGGHSLLATRLLSKMRSRFAISLPLKAIFERSSVAGLAELVRQAAKSEIAAIRPVDRSQFAQLPLSYAQERLWFLNQLEPGSVAYNLPVALRLAGKLDIGQVEQAVQLLIARHESLRTVFPSREGQAHQVILEQLEFHLLRLDVSHYASREERDREARRLCAAEVATPFDLARGPLLRGQVIRLAEDEHVLMFNMHHIISDGWSVDILLSELRLIMKALRKGRPFDLPPLPIQYADYSVLQRSLLEQGGVLRRQLAYWQGKLAGMPESMDLATDHPRPSVQSFAGATQSFHLNAQLCGQLKGLTQRSGGTLFMVLLAAFKVLLYRYTGQGDIFVGTPIANRQYDETEGLIGMFVNTLVLRSQVEGEKSFTALLSQVKATCLEAYEHQDTPFEKVVELLQPQRSLAISPLFQVMVILQNAETGAQEFARYPLPNDTSKFDLTASFTEMADGLRGFIEYSTALYQPQTMERMAEHFTALCRSITAAPTARICDLEYLGPAERQQLLVGYNATYADYPRGECMHELFARQVAVDGSRTAAVCGQQQLSYQQLYDRSYELALYLQAQGVKPDSVVGLCVERSLDMLVGLLGILMAGGAYVPLDPEYPQDRLQYMLQDSQAALVLTQVNLQPKLSGLLPSGTRLITLDEQWAEIAACAADRQKQGVQLERQVEPHHLAYVIYTSGSTGLSKGVLVEHRSVVNLFFALRSGPYQAEQAYGLRVAVNGPLVFDTSVKQIVQLLQGHQLDIIPEPVRLDAAALLQYLKDRQTEVFDCTPSQLRLLLEEGLEQAKSLQLVLVGGEPIDGALWQTLAASQIRFFNVYGPTECTVDATICAISGQKHANPSIGRPIANTQVYILDRHQHLQPVGVPGELHIAGAGLARGYLNRADLTREKFVANPFEPGTRMYMTGDLARWLQDGTIQYLGRIDTQVKIRGFRIELGEIEGRLQEHPRLQDSVVIAQGQDGSKRLVAFYRAVETEGDHVVEVAYEELRAHLLQTLPEYMLPAAFVSLAAIPLNPNGKVDRRALARMEVTLTSAEEYVAPRNSREQQLVEIWPRCCL